MKARTQSLSPFVARGIIAVCAVVFVASAASTALAARVVGTGTAASCADAALNAALADAIPSEACIGDCDGTGLVAINELILGVNIALDLQPANACPAFANSDGMVDVAQLIKGVNNALNALNGCGDWDY
jgi:hypothetical protein